MLLFFSFSVMSDSLQPRGLQHTRFSVLHDFSEFAQTHVHWFSNAIQLSHPLLPPSPPAFIFPNIRVFSNELALHIRRPKYWSFSSASVLPMNIQGWFPLELTGLISLQSKELSRVFSSTTIPKHQFFGTQPSLWSNSNPDMTSGKTIDLTIWNFVGKVMSLLFNMLSRFVVAFLPRIKCLLISYWKESKVEVAKSFTI